MRVTPGLTHISRPLDLAVAGLMTRATLTALSSAAAVAGLIAAGHCPMFRCGSTVMLDVRGITELIDVASGPTEGAVASDPGNERTPAGHYSGEGPCTRFGPFVAARRKVAVRDPEHHERP